MATLGDLQDRIADDLNRTDLSTQILKAINRAIAYYAKEPFWFTETTTTFTTSDGATYYTNSSPAAFPTDISRIQYAEIADGSGNTYELEAWPIERVRMTNVNASEGDPVAYGWWQNYFYTYPIANAARNVTVYYTKTYATLTGTGSSNDFTNNAEDLIEARARWWLYTRVVMDTEQAQLAKLEEVDALKALRERNAGHYADIGIEPTCF